MGVCERKHKINFFQTDKTHKHANVHLKCYITLADRYPNSNLRGSTDIADTQLSMAFTCEENTDIVRIHVMSQACEIYIYIFTSLSISIPVN